MEQLDVYLCNRLAGTLQRDPNGTLAFRYLPDYIASDEAIPLSGTLPLGPEPFGERDIAAFFSNLLPDESVRHRIAAILRLSPEDTFGLLQEIGGDCAGAIAFYEPPRKPSEPTTPTFRKPSNAEAAALLRNLSNRPLGIDDGFRGISGAGAQDKLIACLKGGKVLLPLHGTPSTHIFKPNIDRFPESVFNEWFCMKLSKICGFDTADCDILMFGDEPIYVTRRYDREERDGIVHRIHQEDFCQLLKCRPEIKYQDQGGPSIVECTKLLLSMRLPLSDVISFVNRCVFNFIVGNGDAHGKNFSILYRNGTPRLAPVYDVICTTVYPSIAKKMAMKYDGKFEFRWITSGKIVRTFARAGIGEAVVRNALSRLCALVKDNLPALVDEANVTHPSTIYHDIVQGIHRRIRQLHEKGGR